MTRVRLVAAEDLCEFAESTSYALSDEAGGEILRRAVDFALHSETVAPEVSFITLYASLESVLTHFRRLSEFEILPDKEFSQLERDLKGWLRLHPGLSQEAEKRRLIYEKLRELNRFPFSHVFRVFCEHHRLQLDDLWPLAGRAQDWPLMEIRHRLVHGDPFVSRPADSIECARQHLRWTVARMIFCSLGWPVSRTSVSPEHLPAACETYTRWQEHRARLA